MIKLTKDVKPVAVALDSIVDYDLNSFQLKIREDFSLSSILSSQSKDTSIPKLASFAVSLAENTRIETASAPLRDFIGQIADFFNRKDRADHLFEPEQLLAANDELKLSLLKASLLYDLKLSAIDKDAVNKLGQTNFVKVLAEVRAELE